MASTPVASAVEETSAGAPQRSIAALMMPTSASTWWRRWAASAPIASGFRTA